MKQKWFWGTFVFLLLSASTVISWALISGPTLFKPQVISHVENDFNGQKQKTDFWVNGGSLTDLLPLIEKQWRDENWGSVGSDTNWANKLLRLPANDFDLTDQIQVRIYKKGDLYRVLGLLQSKDTEVTYGMTSDIPQESLDPRKAQEKWDFPIKPPIVKSALYSVHFQRMRIGVILSENSPNLLTVFLENASKAGFTARILSQLNHEKTFLLSNKAKRIIVLFDDKNSQSCLSLVSVDHI